MIDTKKIDYKKAVELILFYEENVEYANDYIVNLCKAAMANEKVEED